MRISWNYLCRAKRVRSCYLKLYHPKQMWYWTVHYICQAGYKYLLPNISTSRLEWKTRGQSLSNCCQYHRSQRSRKRLGFCSFLFNLTYSQIEASNLVTNFQKEIGLVWYKSLLSFRVILQTPILNDDLQRATKNNLEEVYRKGSFESWTRKGAWK